MRIALLIVALLAAINCARAELGTPNRGAPAYVGKWAYNLAWCRNQDGEKVPVTIDANRLDGLENTCFFTRITTDRTGWAVTARCNGEGRTYTEAFHLSVSGNRLTQRSATYSVTWRRCQR